MLGLQEFPQAGTPRVVFEAAFKTAGFEVVRAVRSCALVHKGFGGGGDGPGRRRRRFHRPPTPTRS